MGSSNETSFYGNVQNPWGDKLVPGGSSGGSAAVIAAGIVLNYGLDKVRFLSPVPVNSEVAFSSSMISSKFVISSISFCSSLDRPILDLIKDNQ